MSNHSKGPWRIGDAGTSIFGPPNGQPSPETIATGVRTRANACLISAAPDLLKALKFSLGEWYQYDVANSEDGASERARKKAIKLAENAIDKAEGI